MNCKVSGHASWDRLFPAFLVASKRMEETDLEHSYKYFPSQAAWMWKQQPGYEDNRFVNWGGVINPNGPIHEVQGDAQWEPQPGSESRTRDNGWPSQFSTSRLGSSGKPAEQARTCQED